MPTAVLPRGRRLAFDEHGDPQSNDVVVLFHGAPGSRAFVPGPVGDCRLLTFDRPGYGESDPHDGRTVLDAGVDLAAVLDAIGVERARLVAWSGGCPFAVGAAVALGPERVRSLTLVSGPGPLDEVDGAWDALPTLHRASAEMARIDLERAMRGIDRGLVAFVEQPEVMLGTGRGADGAVMADPSIRAMMERQIRLSVAQGTAGIASDLVAMWRPWEFSLGDVAVATAVFWGAEDPNNRAAAGRYATAIRGATYTEWPTAGHLGIVSNWSQVLAAGSRWGAGR